MPVTTYFEEGYSPGTTQMIVHSGFNYVDLCSIGAGGAGRRGGGGAGGVATKSYRVLESEWGTFLTCSIGVAVASANGLPTTITGTLNGGAITELKGFGGVRGGLSTGGVGGTHSGGDVTAWPEANHDGDAGGDYDSENGIGGPGAPSGVTLLYQGGNFGTGSGGSGDPTNGIIGLDGGTLLRWRV